MLPTLVLLGFPGSSADKESTCNEGDLGSIPEKGKYSSLQNSMLPSSSLEDYIVHGVTKSWTQMNDFQFHFHFQSSAVAVT